MPLPRTTRTLLVGALTGALALGQGMATASAAEPARSSSAVSSAEPVAGTPTLSGSFILGSTATADPGTWEEGVTLAYQWLADDVTVTDATTAFLTLTDDLVGRVIRVEVVGTYPDASTQTVSSAPSLRVVRPGSATATGTAVTGDVLTAQPTGWVEGSSFAHQWASNGVDLPGETGQTLTLTDALIGSAVTVTTTATHAEYASASVTSAPVTIAARTLTSALPTITGVAAAGTVLTAQPGTWTDGTTLAYQWAAGGVAIPGATQATTTVLSSHVGGAITVSVTGTLSGYVTQTRTSDPTPRVVVAGTPTISGTAASSHVVSAAPGTWATGTAFTYQWLAGGIPVAGATARTMTVPAALDGKVLTVAVTGSRASYATVTRTSAPTLRVMRWTQPGVSGTVAYGSTVSARPNTWTSATTFRYQWLLDGKAITGATGSTLKLTSTMRDRRISLRIIGSKAGHPSVTSTSGQTGKVITAGTASVTGTPVQGTTLTARPGTWTASTALTYVWLADGVVITGATRSTFVLTSATRGKRIAVRVTGRKSGYATVAKTSVATARVALVATPTIGGTRLVTYTLSARPGAWTTGTTFTYRWYANGTAISGATGSSLRLSTGLAGKRITVRVTGAKSGHPTVARTSAATAAIGYPSRTTPISGTWNCPSWAPIKGNASSMIYHVPSGAYYSRTNPEECFRTETAAVAAGYRKSKL